MKYKFRTTCTGFRHEKTGELEIFAVEITIDESRLRRTSAVDRAIRSKRGKATALGGAITVTARKV